MWARGREGSAAVAQACGRSQAKKFMRHAKRRTLTTADVNGALRMRNVEPLLGYAAPAGAVAADSGASFEKAAPGLFYRPDAIVNLKDVISTPLPPLPVDISFTAHWLAVDGVQPATPQNPELSEAPPHSSGAASAAAPAAAEAARVEVVPRVAHALSRELQVYYRSVTEGVLATSDRRAVALASVREDPGIHQLLPYFAAFVAERVSWMGGLLGLGCCVTVG